MIHQSGAAKYVTIAFWLSVAVTVVSLVSNYLQYNLIQNAEINGLDLADAESNDKRQHFIAVCQVAVFLACAVTFIIWFYQTYRQLHDMGSNGVTFRRGWAIGVWFVPILNVVRPHQIMKEIWEEHHFIVSGDASFSNNLISLWWGAFIVLGVLQRISNSLYKNVESVAAFRGVTVFDMAMDSVMIVGAICVIRIVRRIVNLQERMEAGEIRQDFLRAGVNSRV